MLDLSIIEVTFTTKSPSIISSAACSFNLVIPKIRSSSILIFLAIFAQLDVVVHLAYHQLLPNWISVTLLYWLLVLLLCQSCSCSNSSWSRRRGSWSKTVVVSLSRKDAIFRDEIENYFSCSHLARQERDYHITILVYRDENGIIYCNSHVLRRDRDLRKSFLEVEREKIKLTLVENSIWYLWFRVPNGINFQKGSKQLTPTPRPSEGYYLWKSCACISYYLALIPVGRLA